MRESDDTSEFEPLVPTEQIRGTTNDPVTFQIIPQRFPREFKSLEIVTIFVVAFDTQHGNVVEWAKPEFMREQLGGLEFKAMPSGAHTMEEDVVYLYDADLYGIACYARLPVQSVEERGFRMRSVGVLCQTFHLLHIHRKELSKLVGYVLENPRDYSQLENYYNSWTGDVTKNIGSLLSIPINLSYPARHFERLLSALGPSLFTVWKAMLLQKRIMFCSPPPAASLCHLVYCANFLMSGCHKIRRDICTPFFFVNIADCDVLSRQVSYIACTTEKVFETKTDIYDVYVDQNEVKVVTSRLKPILNKTSGDKSRLLQLHSTLRQAVSCDNGPVTVEDNFYSYFSELNRLIGERLSRLALSDDPCLSSKDLSAMCLDSSDRLFLCELVDSMNLDISVGSGLCDCLCG